MAMFDVPSVSLSIGPIAQDLENKTDINVEKYISGSKFTYISYHLCCAKMSHELFLEETDLNLYEEMVKIKGKYILANEFSIHWDKDTFEIEIFMVRKFLKRFITPQKSQMGELPFKEGDFFALILDDKDIWFCSACKVALPEYYIHYSTGYAYKLAFLSVTFIPCFWSSNPLPKNASKFRLKFYKFSIPTNRILKGMMRASQSKFLNLITKTDLFGLKSPQGDKELTFSQNSNFNKPQRDCIESIVRDEFCAIQGPPGTGKTTVIVEAIKQLVAGGKYPILICAASNVAVDNVTKLFHGPEYLLIVAVSREDEYNENHELSRNCLHTYVNKEMSPESLSVFRTLKLPKGRVSKQALKKAHKERNKLVKKYVSTAKVILSTASAAAAWPVQLSDFKVAIVDEATQMNDPTTMIPLSFQNLEKFVLVGDHKQLGCFCRHKSFELSFFERLVFNNKKTEILRLEYQFRMHPEISYFSRQNIYDGVLKDGITALKRRWSGFSEKPMLFANTEESQEGTARVMRNDCSSISRINLGEVKLVEQVITQLIDDVKVERSDIGVVTPYAGQRDLIAEKLMANTKINPKLAPISIEPSDEDFDDVQVPSTKTVKYVSGIMIASVDAFQGREKNFMILSCVRSNSSGDIGFLKDQRRLNVALTRARYEMIIIGNSECLMLSGGIWEKFISHLETKDLIIDAKDFSLKNLPIISYTPDMVFNLCLRYLALQGFGKLLLN